MVALKKVLSNRATSLIRPLLMGPEGGRINEVSLYKEKIVIYRQ